MNSSDRLDFALSAHLKSRPTRAGAVEASANFEERCRDAALAALDVLKMRRQLVQVEHSPGSLFDLLNSLAGRASLGLERVFRSFGVQPSELPDESSVRGLARLSVRLGLSEVEAALRLRWGFARMLTPALIGSGASAVPLPIRGRRTVSNLPEVAVPNFDSLLQHCELQYSAERRLELRTALAIFDEAFRSGSQ